MLGTWEIIFDFFFSSISENVRLFILVITISRVYIGLEHLFNLEISLFLGGRDIYFCLPSFEKSWKILLILTYNRCENITVTYTICSLRCFHLHKIPTRRGGALHAVWEGVQVGGGGLSRRPQSYSSTSHRSSPPADLCATHATHTYTHHTHKDPHVRHTHTPHADTASAASPEFPRKLLWPTGWTEPSELLWPLSVSSSSSLSPELFYIFPQPFLPASPLADNPASLLTKKTDRKRLDAPGPAHCPLPVPLQPKAPSSLPGGFAGTLSKRGPGLGPALRPGVGSSAVCPHMTCAPQQSSLHLSASPLTLQIRASRRQLLSLCPLLHDPWESGQPPAFE